MLDIIMDADNEIYEENLLIISDAYEVAILTFTITELLLTN